MRLQAIRVEMEHQPECDVGWQMRVMELVGFRHPVCSRIRIRRWTATLPREGRNGNSRVWSS